MDKFSETQSQVLEAYQLWRELTVREGVAIREHDWISVTESQSAKTELQPRILHLAEAIELESASLGAPSSRFQSYLHALLADLVALEQANLDCIRESRLRKQRQKEELDQATRTLGRIQRTYRHIAEPSWSSYS